MNKDEIQLKLSVDDQLRINQLRNNKFYLHNFVPLAMRHRVVEEVTLKAPLACLAASRRFGARVEPYRYIMCEPRAAAEAYPHYVDRYWDAHLDEVHPCGTDPKIHPHEKLFFGDV
ncbi:MAG: uncharacterized protein KVP18_003568 [Porospora cf. gigantea A]|uniref:uncharacterized protein n=1 Tax=Porospora cf. gigantea A TaxID=2853593 RepID=UPI003559554B|nr:MAG: hypothetical protein KVP18_003568 [Porospora cf. gigantea A]